MDESTSNLDFGTENVIFDTIYNKLPDRTMLIVAHRLSTIKNCDKIIVLDDGKVIEQGTHEELLSREGRYYELWQLQMGTRTARADENASNHVKSDVTKEVGQTEANIKNDDETVTYT